MPRTSIPQNRAAEKENLFQIFMMMMMMMKEADIVLIEKIQDIDFFVNKLLIVIK